MKNTFFFYLQIFLILYLSASTFSADSQTLHSATDSVALGFTLSADSNTSVGFIFSPTQDLFVDQLGKNVPDSGAHSWIIWNAASRTKVYQQNSLLDAPAQYIYEKVDPQTALILKKGEKYNLQLFYRNSSSMYAGPSQVGQHLIYYESSMCLNCDTNTYPANAYYAPFQYGVPDFLYSLTPTKRGMNDAAVISVDTSSVFCQGIKDIYTTIGNYGLNQIDSVEVHWEFNGITQPIVKYRQLLDTMKGSNPSTARVLLGSKNFNPGESNIIKVWTSMPNGSMDTVIYGDTLEVYRRARLSGNFTINPNIATGNGNYASFSDLADDLNNLGVCGPVNITVSPGTYNEYLYLKEIPGASATNTITIDGLDSSTVLLTHNASVINNTINIGTVTLEGTDYLTIRNITIESTDSTRASSILFLDGANHNTISNCKLKVIESDSYSINNIVFSLYNFSFTAGADVNGNVIKNNTIIGGRCGLLMEGPRNNLNKANKIINNVFSNFYSTGIDASRQDSMIVSGNIISISKKPSIIQYTASLRLSENLSVHNNFFYGASLITASASTVYNNFIVSKEFNVAGLILSGDSIAVFHNSISVSGVSPAISIGNNSNKLNIRNNIFSSEHGFSFSSDNPSSIFIGLDYNIYYSKGAALFNIGGLIYSDLISFQTAFPLFNGSSLEGDPQFISSNSDLHLVGNLANEAGDNSVGIAYDIDGDTRSSVSTFNVDIGADEYTPASCVPLVELTAHNTTLNSAILEWQAGSFSPSGYQVEVVLADSLQGTGDTIYTSVNNISIAALDPATDYEFYVRQICGRGDTSIWRGPQQFSTADSVVYFENFEDFNNGKLAHGWTSTAYMDITWLQDTTTSYGPLEDHTVGLGGTFLYLYSQNTGSLSGSSNLVSPSIYVDTNKIIELSFWYHMYGGGMGNLNVYVDTNGVSNLVTTISGQKQAHRSDPWLEYSTYLYDYQGKYIQLRFEGVKGTGISSMAIDDITLDTVPAINAGVTELYSPQGLLCARSFLPHVAIKNYGLVDIDSVMIFSEVNGVLTDSLLFTKTILPGDTSIVTLDSITFNSGIRYNVRFYTKNPNSIADPIPTDDILSIRSGLWGDYTINSSLAASDTNFTSFTSAVKALNKYGICGPVTITIAPGIYNESVILDEINGANSTNTITFDGQDSINCILSDNSNVATFMLNGSDYVTINNLTIENNNTLSGSSIQCINGVQHNMISNNILKIKSNSYPNIYFPPGISNHNTIIKNRIEGGDQGLFIQGTFNNLNVSNKVLYNEMDTLLNVGIQIYYQDSFEVTGNKIKVDLYGIYVGGAINSLINANFVQTTRGSAIYCYSYSLMSSVDIKVNNNIVITDARGIHLNDVSEFDIFHNSISSSLVALDIQYANTLPSNYDIRNNILKSINKEALRTYAPVSIFAELNHNSYYTESDTLLRIDGIAYADLSAFQSVVPALNINSIEGDPQFTSPIDLHIIGSFVDGKGDNTVGITEDIDGDPRPMPGSTTVDIGADEFDPLSCPPVYNLSALNVSPDSVTLQWFGGSGHFEYEIVHKDSTQGTGMSDSTSFNNLRVGDLSPNTDYEFYAREICAIGDTSIWWGPIAFSTPQAVTDLSVDSLLSPIQVAQDSCVSSTTSNIELSIVNQGNMYIDFTQDTTNVSLDVTGAVAQSYTYQLNDNSLNAGNLLAPMDTIVISLATLNMGNVGIYNFRAYLELGIDSKNTNDTLIKTISYTSGGVLSAAEDSICGPGNIVIKAIGSQGTLQWQRLVGGVFTNETGAGSDSTSYLVFIDSTTTFRTVACGSVFSDTFTIELITAKQPVALDSTLVIACGDTGTVALIASSSNPNAFFEWYDVPAGGNPLSADSNIVDISANGDTLYYRGSSIAPNNPSIDTFYVQETVTYAGEILITEMDLDTDLLEIQNTSSRAVDVTGWTVAVGDHFSNINQHSFVTLSGTMQPGEIRSWSNGTAGNIWPSVIQWNPGSQYTGWIIVLDAQGKIVDVLFENWTQTQIQTMNTTINGHPITINNEWFGDGIHGNSAVTGLSLQRIGNIDNNDSADFILQNASHEVINPGLNLPFPDRRCVGPRDTVIATIDCLVGLEEAGNSFANISIQPNPSKGIFHIVGKHVKEEMEISIYNTNGKLVYQSAKKFSNNFDKRIDISGFAKGLYFVKFQGKQSFEMRKIIIN